MGAYLTAQPNKHVKKPRHGRNLDQIPEECSILGEKKDGVKSKKTKKARRKRGKKKKEVDGHNREIKIESSSDIKQISSKLEDSPETMENYLALDSDVERHLSISKSENTNFEADLKITNISDHSFLDEVPHGDVVCQMTVGNISTCSTDCTPADICKPTSTISFPIVDNFVPPDSVNSPFCNTGNSIASTYSCKTQDDNIALPISASVEVVDNWESAAKQSRVAILQLEDLMVTPRMDVVQESDFFSDVDSTDGDAVPPDQLSEQDDSMSDSERSVNSNDLQQAAEDDQFFESSYNCNQNLEQTVHIPAQDAASTINESPNENASNKNSVVDGPERFSSTPTDSSPSIIAKEVPNCVLPNACSSRQFLDDIYFCQQKRVLPAHEERNSNPSLSDNLPDDILNFLSILKLKSIKNLTPDKVLSFPYGQKFIQRTAKVSVSVSRSW